MIRWMALLACVLTIVITAASAFLRHTQAGLGCTPWPACYRDAAARRSAADGEATAASPAASSAVAVAPPAAVAPSNAAIVPPASSDPRVVSVVRALHRVAAALVGLLVLGVALFGWSRFATSDRLAGAFALADTVFLSWLGRYTPHDSPLVTLGNVLGGFALAAAFGWIAIGPDAPRRIAGSVRTLARGGLALVALQSAVGVMISVRHAVDACAGLLCAPSGAPSGAPVRGLFDPTLALVVSAAADGRPLHLAHRGLALVLALMLALAALALLWRSRTGAGSAGRAAGGDRSVTAARWPLIVLVWVALLAVVGGATASGGPGNLTGTLHTVLAATLFVLFAALARGGRH